MAHKTLINGTAYGVKGGKTKINCTNYSVKQGKALVGGTTYGIGFLKEYTENLQMYASNGDITNINSWSVVFTGSSSDYNIVGFYKSSGNNSVAHFYTAHPISSIKSIRFAMQEQWSKKEINANSNPDYSYNGKMITVTYKPGFLAGQSSGLGSFGGLSGFRINTIVKVYITYLSEE